MSRTLIDEGRAMYAHLLTYTVDAAQWVTVPPGHELQIEPGKAYQRVDVIPGRPVGSEVGSGLKTRTVSIFQIDLLVPIAGHEATDTPTVVDNLEALLSRGKALCDHFWPRPRGPRSYEHNGVCCRMQKPPYLSGLQDEMDSEMSSPHPFKKIIVTVPYTVDD